MGALEQLLAALALQAREHRIDLREVGAQLSGTGVRQRALSSRGEVRERALQPGGDHVALLVVAVEQAVQLELFLPDRSRLEQERSEGMIEAGEVVLGGGSVRARSQVRGRFRLRASEHFRGGVLDRLPDGCLQRFPQGAQARDHRPRAGCRGQHRSGLRAARGDAAEVATARDQEQGDLSAHRLAGDRGEDLHRRHHVEVRPAAELDRAGPLDEEGILQVIGAEPDAGSLGAAADAVLARRISAHALDALEPDPRRPPRLARRGRLLLLCLLRGDQLGHGGHRDRRRPEDGR